jgi:hypothetical protein
MFARSQANLLLPPSLSCLGISDEVSEHQKISFLRSNYVKVEVEGDRCLMLIFSASSITIVSYLTSSSHEQVDEHRTLATRLPCFQIIHRSMR